MLRLATWNVLSGRDPAAAPSSHTPAGAGSGQASIAILARDIAALDADVVALQEVDYLQPRSGRRDQTADLVAHLSAADPAWTGRFLPTLWGTPGLTRQWTPATGGSTPLGALADPAYGIALLTRLPVRSWQHLRWSSSWGRLPMLVPRPSGRGVSPLLVPDEPRAALGAVVETPLGPLSVVGTHLSFLPPRAIRQLRALTSWAQGLPAPQVVLGDLNLPGRLPATITGWRQLAIVASYPAHAPKVQLDHVLGRDLDGVTVLRARAQLGERSDHRAVVVDLSRP